MPVETTATRDSYGIGKLVGRDDELGRLLAFCLDRTGDATLAALAGVSGASVNRGLLRELTKKLQLLDVSCVEATCYGQTAASTKLAPLVRCCDALVRLLRANGHGDVEARHASALAWLTGDERLDHVSVSEHESRRLRRLSALADFFVDLCGVLDVVVHIDDCNGRARRRPISCASCGGRLSALRDGQQPGHLPLLVSYRLDEVAGRPVAELLAALGERCRRVDLAPLDAAGTREIWWAPCWARTASGGASSTRLFDETGGNPFCRRSAPPLDGARRHPRQRGRVDLACVGCAGRAAVDDRRCHRATPGDRRCG